ncbi:MAG: D-tyrosyl-tRNA(Tyr) deacylase [Acidobacteria bacterium]|nr:MAG: D-tyrosyl-tRNA(Tyr) deacylase [Acidobacteriota bacterium]
MRAVIQRVTSAAVKVGETCVGKIGHGLLVLLGVGAEDREADADYLADKIVHLRIFPDERGKMNRSLTEVNGHILVVSQFTLYGDCRRGRRPSYSAAAPPDRAKRLYEYFVARLKSYGVHVETGVFQEMMDVELINHGPVTILLDSQKTF